MVEETYIYRQASFPGLPLPLLSLCYSVSSFFSASHILEEGEEGLGTRLAGRNKAQLTSKYLYTHTVHVYYLTCYLWYTS